MTVNGTRRRETASQAEAGDGLLTLGGLMICGAVLGLAGALWALLALGVLFMAAGWAMTGGGHR